MDRRTTMKWMLAVAAAAPGVHADADALEADSAAADPPSGQGYGTDPDLLKVYKPGELWPLTFTARQKRTAGVLCDLIIPADATSPSASAVGVVGFLDEWISAPYKTQRKDRTTLLNGLAWLDSEAAKRFKERRSFVALSDEQRTAVCDDICFVPKANPDFVDAAKFFARFRDLTAGGFYTTPQGREDVRYVGNVPLARFDGPPLEVLKKVGLA
jgi:gluconate 2-dehydrogenase subunit 3-like protein